MADGRFDAWLVNQNQSGITLPLLSQYAAALSNALKTVPESNETYQSLQIEFGKVKTEGRKVKDYDATKLQEYVDTFLNPFFDHIQAALAAAEEDESESEKDPATDAIPLPAEEPTNVEKVAAELHSGGIKEAKWRSIKPFAKKYNVTEKDVGTIQAALERLRKGDEGQRQAGVANRKLATARGAESGVFIVAPGIEVHLDVMQLKHQPPNHPIGTRVTHHGNSFNNRASREWHQANTLVYMRDWALGLGVMANGQEIQHGQFDPVDGIHYEGSCLFVDGLKYVSFHCYPAKNLALPK